MCRSPEKKDGMELKYRGAAETSQGSNSSVETKGSKREVVRVEMGDLEDSQAMEVFECQSQTFRF